jgi:oxalate decarboxylase/phosphoglucose isomerase-like protein (cupin superfamily)
MRPFAVRRHEEMKDVLFDPKADGPEIHYYMIRGGRDKTNITIWESGNVGGEYIKTYGHYHVGDIEEIYRIVGGEGIILLQKRKIDHNGIPIDDEIETFTAIKVKTGDCIFIPSEFGHILANIGKTWLVTIDNSPLRLTDDAQFPSHANYDSIKRMHGLSYYIIDDNGRIKLIKNTNYKFVPEIQWMNVTEWNNEWE